MAIEAVVIREAEVVSESPFFIPMTGPAATPRRALKHDDTFRCARSAFVARGRLNTGTGFRELKIQIVGSCSNHTGDGLGPCGCCNRRRRGVAR
jgi:hypothetical protein